jgi:4-hydroxy-3-polyprenylbenzoate decarboxylase
MNGRIIVALTGASGAGYGVELIKGLNSIRENKPSVSAITSSGARNIINDETGLSSDDIASMVDEILESSVMDSPVASGSNIFDSLVICPCTVSTACKIASGIADNLITRVAAVALKERRMIILAIRETPLSTPVLESLCKLSTNGVIVMPLSPPLYGGPESVEDLQRIMAGRIMDLLGIQNDLVNRYRSKGTDY